MGKRSTFTPDLRQMVTEWLAAGYAVEIDANEAKIRIIPKDQTGKDAFDMVDYRR